MSIFELFQNAAVLLAMVAIYDVLSSRLQLMTKLYRQLIAGLFIGSLGIFLIIGAVELEPGIIFDTRSVLLSVSGLFFGSIPTAVATVMTGAYRIWQGGTAALTGVSVIAASSLIGILWRRMRRKPLDEITLLDLFALGLVVHVVMLALMLTLPWNKALHVLSVISLPVMLIHPASTVAIGSLMRLRLRRERTQAELSASEKQFRRLSAALEQAGDAILITDTKGSIIYANPAFETMTGYTCDEALGCTPALLKSGEHDDPFYQDLWQTITSGKTWRGQIINRHKTGSLYTGDTTISQVRNEQGEITGFVAVKRDISEKLRMQKQLQQAQRMESVGRLAGGVAHDFNNMLTGILGYTELCQEMLEPDNPLQPYLQEIKSTAQRSANLPRQLLAFARRQVIVPKLLNLNDTIENMLKLLRRLIGEHIDLQWVPGPEPWPVIMDAGQIDQMLANLCINARDAIDARTGECSRRVTIATSNVQFDEAFCADHPGAVAGDYVRVQVEDSGCGIAKEQLTHIFEPFYTTKAVGKGTGLGLATVYGMIKQNNGYIDITSMPGEGTTVRLYFPRSKATTDAIDGSPADDLEKSQGGTETLLLVEDELAILETLKSFLGTLGYKVHAFNAPNEALAFMQQTKETIDLLLSDVIMPDLSGFALARKLKERHPTMETIFMSGYTADEITKHKDSNESFRLIEKPFNRREVAAMIRKTLDHAEEALKL